MTKILVIEDENPLREEIADILRFEGFEVLEAPNGEIGLAITLEHHPELIICDVVMPEMDGFSVLRKVREHSDTATIPLIFLTARVAKNDVRQGMNLGADDYLTKPFTHEELLSAINARLKRHTALTELGSADLERAKERLTRMVAHELRTPLVSIKMVSDIITRRVGQLSTEQMQDLLGSLDAGSKRLSHLVEQMVLMTHLDAGFLSQDIIKKDGLEIHVSDLLTAAINMSRQFLKRPAEVNVELDVRNPDTTILSDTASLKHAIAELISNALTFSPEHSTVWIMQWQQGSSTWISIRDEGSGIPETQLETALEAFQQIDREKLEQQGMGLGLALALRIIKLHRGHLQLNSVVNKGTEALIELPVYTKN